MKTLESETQKLISKLQHTSKEIKKKFNISKFHYIQLCAYFNSFIDTNLTIEESQFLSANSSLSQSEEITEETIENLSKQIFKIIKGHEQKASLYALYAYLNTITINDDLDTNLLMSILAKEDKSFIDGSEIESFTQPLEDFIGKSLDWNEFKSMTKDRLVKLEDLNQDCFLNNFKELVDGCKSKISELVNKSFDNDIINNNLNISDEKTKNNEEDKKSKDSKSKKEKLGHNLISNPKDQQSESNSTITVDKGSRKSKQSIASKKSKGSKQSKLSKQSKKASNQDSSVSHKKKEKRKKSNPNNGSESHQENQSINNNNNMNNNVDDINNNIADVDINNINNGTNVDNGNIENQNINCISPGNINEGDESPKKKHKMSPNTNSSHNNNNFFNNALGNLDNNNNNTIPANLTSSVQNNLNSGKEFFDSPGMGETSSPKHLDFSDSSMLFKSMLDKKKETKIHQIKLTSLLYDMNLNDIYEEFKKYQDKNFDKDSFISTINGIIQKRTSNLFKGPVQRYSLSLLFQYMDIEKKNSLSYYEALGALIALTKARNEEKINLIFSLPKNKVKLVLTGMISLYINTEVVKDLSILAEIFQRAFIEMKINNAQSFYELLFNDNDIALNNSIDFMAENNSDDEYYGTSHPANNELLLEALNCKYFNSIFGKTSSISIIEVTNLMVNKFSLLGQMNIYQLLGLIDNLLNRIFGKEESKDRDRAKSEFFNFVEKYFDFSKNELFEMNLIHSLFILIFSGSTREKVRSIFKVHETDENKGLESADLTIYLQNMFHFMLLEMKLDDNNLSKYMGKRVVDIISKGEKDIPFIQLILFFEGINLD